MSDFKIYEAYPDSYPDAAHVDISKEPISDQIAYGQLGKKFNHKFTRIRNCVIKQFVSIRVSEGGIKNKPAGLECQ